jgi:hypothetical protein
MLKHCAANRKRRLSALPNVGPYTYDVKFLTLQEAPYIYDISRLWFKDGLLRLFETLAAVLQIATFNNSIIYGSYVWYRQPQKHRALRFVLFGQPVHETCGFMVGAVK